jgi:hypothetical protein
MFRGAELTRLVTMIVFLGVLGMLIVRARDPHTWKWFANQSESTEAADKSPQPDAGSKSVAPGASGKESKEEAAKDKDKEVVTPGPTDEDSEQKADSAEEFQAISDGTVGIQPEEMFAYWRLFLWTEHQSFADMKRRAYRGPIFSDLMQTPDKSRGRLIELDLNVRRVIAYDVDDCPLETRRVYEIWGFTDESQAWPYVVVTAHLPRGIPVGTHVAERARFVGYFFKLHGYYEAGAKPRAKPLRTPFLVGRLQGYPSAVRAPGGSEEIWVGLAMLAIMVLLGGSTVGRYFFGRPAGKREAVRQEHVSQSVHEWIREGRQGDSPAPVVEEDQGEQA